MKKKNNIIACLLICILLAVCFSSCGDKNSPDAVVEPESENEVSYLAQEQGICVMSACRMTPDTESASLSHQEDIAGIVVYNDSEKTLQYAEITALFSDDTVHMYKISTLPPGEACFVSEENNAPYRELTTGFFGFEINNVAFFSREPSVHEDKLQFSGADGILNIKNISEADITDNIIVYYKDYKDSHLASGITYRVTVEGGLKAGEVKQVRASHYTQNESIIMFAQFISAEVS